MKAAGKAVKSPGKSWFNRLGRDLKRNKVLYFMLIPGMTYFLLFKYGSMYGLVIAFMDYNPFRGIGGSSFVGFDHFIRLFSERTFGMLFQNTLPSGDPTAYFIRGAVIALRSEDAGKILVER